MDDIFTSRNLLLLFGFASVTNEEYVPLKVILPVTSIGVFLTALDGSIVNITLPVIRDALGSDINRVSWVIVAYLLTLSSFMGLGGALGDNYGRKKIFQSGMLIFGLGSLMCSLSPNVNILIFSRVIQALGAVGIQSNGLALVITYINPEKRGRAIGINSLVVASALSLGPPLGGILSDIWGWESIFWINIPISLVGIVAVQMTLKETKGTGSSLLDYIGVFLFAITAFFFIGGMKLSLEENPIMVILLILSPIVGYIFVKHEIKHKNPVLSISLMKNKQIMFGALAAIFSYAAINVATILLPFYFSEVLGISQTNIGLYLIVVPVALTIMGPPAGFLAEKFNTRLLATFGAAMQTIMLLILSFLLIYLNEDIKVWHILILIGLSAAFLSFFSNSNGTRVMNSSNENELSIVSGILNLSRNVGFTLGSSLSPALFVIFRQDFSSNLSGDGVYVRSLGYTFLVFTLFALIGTFFSFYRGEEGIVSKRHERSEIGTKF